MNGVIIIDKPAAWTSHDVVNRMRRILQQRSVGHLGTLDPLATGVLPLVTGNLTRLAQFYTTSDKTYEGVIRFGFATNTYDADGEPVEVNVGTAEPGCPEGRRPDLSLEALQKLAVRFLGTIEQVPPPFSAKKIHGVPAYKLARKQKEVVLQPVQVEIKEFDILAVEGDRARFRARVASGTYMRSVAHEMGQLQGSGAHLASLRRTAVAEFDITQAHTLEEIEAKMKGGQIKEGKAEEKLINPCHSEAAPAAESLPRASEARRGEPAVSRHEGITALFIHPRQLLPQLPSVTADEPTAARIRTGRTVNLPDVSRARQVKVFQGQSDLIAIATRIAGTLFHPKIVFSEQ
ncbi:MAG: tRNA pseudouridine(55) synthase TruB [Candidatus Sulfotelmatobacter sp.]|jgi:tRNA pseudouridine55 synthase